MNEFKIRTEDLRTEEILGIYVATQRDVAIVDALKSPNPIVLEGSRGTGKSLLMRVAEAQLLDSIEKDRVLPVYISFAQSSLVHTTDVRQFHHWMLAKMCSRILRTLYKTGFLSKVAESISILGGGDAPVSGTNFRMEEITAAYEASWKHPGIAIDPSTIPSIETFKDAIEDICNALNIRRLCLLFDEAAHIFRPGQQREFFTLFRDLRSPYISCNAAVYPGVTSFGATFDVAHDATLHELNRDVQDVKYREYMREIVSKQAESNLMSAIERHSENFNALAYAVSGNPRLLLKTVQLAPTMSSKEVNAVLKDFYRVDIWREHSGLAERYAGHRSLIDWGRNFIEHTVIPDTRAKNAQWLLEGRNESTATFWMHRDIPAAVKEALRLLAYTGVVIKRESGVVATRGETGTRYSLNLGCLVASEATPVTSMTSLVRQLTIRRFTEYGKNAAIYKQLVDAIGHFEEPDMSAILTQQLGKTVDELDVTDFQKTSLHQLGLDTIGDALGVTEQQLQQAKYVGPVRSRRMHNAVVTSVLEYLSG
jgi:hypothetical protein